MTERMKQLVEQLNRAAKAYYQEDREILSNQEYDALYDELAALEEKTGTILANSPTQKVGYTVLSNLVKVAHESPILSLDKTKETAKPAFMPLLMLKIAMGSIERSVIEPPQGSLNTLM